MGFDIFFFFEIGFSKFNVILFYGVNVLRDWVLLGFYRFWEKGIWFYNCL